MDIVDEAQNVFQDTVPFDVTDEVQVGDLTAVKEDQFIIDAVQDVGLTVSKASIKKRLVQYNASEDPVNNPCISKAVSVHWKVGAAGVDGEGKYANKVVFMDYLIWVDNTHEFFSAEKYKKNTQPWLFGYKELVLALGYPVDPPPPVNDVWLTEIVGLSVTGNITKKELRQLDNNTGKWEGTGDFKNEVRKLRAV